MYTKNVYSVLNKVASEEEPSSRIRGYLAKRAAAAPPTVAEAKRSLNDFVNALESSPENASAHASRANARVGKLVGKNKVDAFNQSDFLDENGLYDPSKLAAILRAARRHGKKAIDTYGKELAYGGSGLGIGALAGALAMRKNRALGGLLGAILGTGAGIGTKYLVDKYGNDVVNYVKGLRGKTEQA